MNIKKDDTVQVITGKDKGKKGKVRYVLPSNNAVIVEGHNIVKKHTKGRSGARQAGIIEQEASLSASKVMVICPACGKPSRVGHTFTADGQKVRVCRNCGETFDTDSTQSKWGGRR
jgi:large subunit ribosomal protein L24